MHVQSLLWIEHLAEAITHSPCNSWDSDLTSDVKILVRSSITTMAYSYYNTRLRNVLIANLESVVSGEIRY